MGLRFLPADVRRAAAILERERERIARIGIEGDLVLSGGSSVEGALTGGDVDLHLRVAAGDFADMVAALRGPYAVRRPEIWGPTLATFGVPGEEVGIAVTPIGSVHDRRFLVAWQRLRQEPATLEAYNALKRRHRGGDRVAYEAAKAAFFGNLDPSDASRG